MLVRRLGLLPICLGRGHFWLHPVSFQPDSLTEYRFSMTIWENILSDFDKNPLKIARILASANVKSQIPPAPATWTHPGQSPPRGQNQPLSWVSVGLLPVCPRTSSTSPHRLGQSSRHTPDPTGGGPAYPPLLLLSGAPREGAGSAHPRAALCWWAVWRDQEDSNLRFHCPSLWKLAPR